MIEQSSLSLRDIIDMFAMERHPMSGWYCLHYSDSETIGRAKLSAIYYLLPQDEPMAAHKSDAVEVWSHFMGAPAEFTVTNGSRMQLTSTLGPDLAAGQRPQMAIPAYLWQSCRSLGAWTLLGCTASPGFSPRAAFIMDAED
jgi:predicted cupin superfamily sugar epimerase